MDEEPIMELIMDIVHTSSLNDIVTEPSPIIYIHHLAETSSGWCRVVEGLIANITLENPLGPSVIYIIFIACPLPLGQTVITFIKDLQLTRNAALAVHQDEEICFARNVLVVLDCIADKFIGTYGTQFFTRNMLSYLITFLMEGRSALLIGHAIITIERMASLTENKRTIEREFLEQERLHPLLPLEMHYDSANLQWRQVGFIARWALDNTFLCPGRNMSYECVDMAGITVMLNHRDASNYLKISPDGLEARSDSHFFESVRATFQINDGVWYYEVTIITEGVMQIGWATKDTCFQNQSRNTAATILNPSAGPSTSSSSGMGVADLLTPEERANFSHAGLNSEEGFGVGDDAYSVGYDGCRRLIWHMASATRLDGIIPSWKPGDIVGCLIDVPNGEVIFSLNGCRVPPRHDIFDRKTKGFYPAASFMAYQQCRFNFGSKPFQFPPLDKEFRIMNDHGLLTDEEKKIIPRRIELELMLSEEPGSSPENRCVVCLDAESQYTLQQCGHSGFCAQCVPLLHECPLCRRIVTHITKESA